MSAPDAVRACDCVGVPTECEAVRTLGHVARRDGGLLIGTPLAGSLHRYDMSPPYSTIVSPTDLSPIGDRAVAVAYLLAGPKSVIHLLYVRETVATAYSAAESGARPFAERAQTPEIIESLARSHLLRLVPTDSLARGVRTEVHVVHDSRVALQIVQEATRLGAEAIVMGSHGRTGVGRVLLGSVAFDVLKTKGIPRTVIVHDCNGR